MAQFLRSKDEDHSRIQHSLLHARLPHMDEQSSRTTHIYLGLLFVVVVWGINFVVMKYALNQIDPLVFIGTRILLAGGILLGILIVAEGWKSIKARDWLIIIILGLIGNTLFQMLNINGLHFSRPENAALIQSTIPIWSAIIAALAGLDKITGRMAIGIAISFASVITVIMAAAGGFTLGQSVIGDFMILGSAVSWAIYTVFSRDLLARYSPLRVSTLMMLTGIPPLMIFTLPAMIATDWLSIDLGVFVAIAFSGTVALAINYVIWSVGVQRVGPARTAIFNNLVPVITFIAAFVTLNLPIAELQIIGGAGVLVGVWITIRSK